METMTIRSLTVAVAAAALAASPAHAGKKADYGVNIGISPFGGSIGLGYHHTKKTTFQVAFGGSPAFDAPFKLKRGEEEYTQNAGSSWMGFFVNHRPFADAEWLRVNTGLAVGHIEGTVTGDDNGEEYKVEYKENPVGYLGIGFGAGTDKGIFYGFDIGALFSSGPEITAGENGTAQGVEDFKDSAALGSVLPNFQLTLGYNF